METDNSSSWLADITKALESARDFYNTQQFEEISRIYAEDIRLFPPGIPEKHGRNAVVAIFKEMFSLGGVRVEMSEYEIIKDCGDWAMAKQHFALYSSKGEELFTAKMVHSWRRNSGKPEMTLAIWNFDGAI